MEIPNDVMPRSSAEGSEPLQTQPPATSTPVVVEPAPATPAGSKTPETNLLAALKEEREKRRLLEDENEKLKNTTAPSEIAEVYSDEGRELKKMLDATNEKLVRMEESRELESVLNQYPALKDKQDEFEEYRKDFPRHKLANAAKLFLSEKGLLETAPTRMGLEPATGGVKTPPQAKLSVEDIKRLRENDHRKYMKYIQTGVIRPEEI